jgi:hypothetical protein
MEFLAYLFVVFLVLKLLGGLVWSWLFVFSPLIIFLILFILIVGYVCLDDDDDFDLWLDRR